MAGKNENYSDAADEARMAKEHRDHDRKLAKLEALEDNFKKSISNMMRNPNVKKALAFEAREATRHSDGKFRGRSLEELGELSGRQFSNEGSQVTDEEALYRPWEE